MKGPLIKVAEQALAWSNPRGRSLARRNRELQRKRTRFGLRYALRVASLSDAMKPATGGEAAGKQPSDSPGRLEAAREERSAEEPGRPVESELGFTGVGQPIVAGKRVTTVERRG